MFYGKVEICGVDTSKLKTLTEDEKKSLLSAASKGDGEARQKLINGNLRLVLSIIQRFSNRGENLDDLFQVGCIGLIKAVDNFNTALDVRFSTYAVPMIIGELKRYLRDNNSIRVSRSTRDLAYRALSVRERLSKSMAREPTVDDIAAELQKEGDTHRREDIIDALEAIIDPVSLYDPVYGSDGGGDSVCVMDTVSDNGGTEEVWLDDISLREAMRVLSDREKAILGLRFFGGKTQMEIAEEIGISQAQVSRLEKGALEHMRKCL
jgi:RNA polymerase sigma-70 factor, sigma-B/F/G subfamily